MGDDRRADDLQAADPVTPPARRASAPADRHTAVLVAAGAGIGAAVAGAPGALLGGGVGWAVDAIRRRLTA